LMRDIVARGDVVLFIGTKRQAQESIRLEATRCGMPYINQRWLGGTLTNFRTIRSRLARLEYLEAMQENGSFESESKKQTSRLKREMRKIQANLDGVRKMTQLPGAVVVVDAKKEYIALAEARKLGIPTIGVLDTDSDPDTVDVVIPANDDSIRAVSLILNELAEAVSIGKTMVSAKELKHKPKRQRSRTVLARADEAQEPSAEDVAAKPQAPQNTVPLQAQTPLEENSP